MRRGQSGTDLHQISANLVGCVEASCSLFRVSAPSLPTFGSVGEIKEFCAGLLDPSGPAHPLREWLDAKEAVFRASFAHSLFLFRKTLPAGSRGEAVSSFVKKMTTPSKPVDPAFLDFCKREVPRLFRSGWDHRYQRATFSLSPPTSASYTSSRKVGGIRGSCSTTSRAAAAVSRGILETRPLGRIPVCKVRAVADGGKWRVVTVNPDDCLALRPLHSVIYDHLSTKKWLLRGDAKSSSFSDFSLVKGEEFVSGDYEAATDNIPLELYRVLLDAVALTSSHVPREVWSLARQETRKLFVGSKGQLLGVQERGQLMGSYLSFPFLCLLNYLCFKWAVPRKGVPVRINGDDIVFRCRPDEKERWFAQVANCGLVVSRGKTMVDNRFFTLNSCLFKGGEKRSSAVGFFRSKAYFSKPDTADAMVGQLASVVVGFPGSSAKDKIMASFLGRNRRILLWSQLSLTRDLHARVSIKVLRLSGLYDRERFYLGLPVPSRPHGVVPAGFRRAVLPVGHRGRRGARVEERLFHQHLIELSWLGRAPEIPVWRGTFRYVPRLKTKFPVRYGGLSVFLGKVKEVQGGREEYWSAISLSPLRARPILWVRGGQEFGGGNTPDPDPRE